jgi:phosphoglycolate phosphatase (TIGR01487 family)
LIRALAVDIDGTLTDEKRIISPSAVEAVSSLEIPVVLTTGNTHCFTRTMAIMLGTPLVFIAENGGVVSYSDNEMEMVADINICEAAFQELSREFNLTRHDSRYRFTDITLKRDFDLEAAKAYVLDHNLPVDLIDTFFAVHIKVRDVDKGTGLRKVAEHMGLSLREFGAIGDSLSDMPMFNLAGFRACVGNSNPRLKAISDYVANADYGAGFAEIVRHMAEQKMFQADTA